MDLEARHRFEGIDLADDVTPARIGVQPDQEGQDQKERGKQADPGLFGNAQRRVAAADRKRRARRRGFSWRA
jgi:hypothetical protein